MPMGARPNVALETAQACHTRSRCAKQLCLLVWVARWILHDRPFAFATRCWTACKLPPLKVSLVPKYMTDLSMGMRASPCGPAVRRHRRIFVDNVLSQGLLGAGTSDLEQKRGFGQVYKEAGKFHGSAGRGPNFFLKIILFFVNMKTRKIGHKMGILRFER